MAAPVFNGNVVGNVKGYVTPPNVFRPEDYGAKGDVRTFYDANTTNGSAVLTSTEAHFTQSDVGKSVCVTDGLTFACPLIATIVSVQSATQCTMSATATSTITGTNQGSVGTDDTAAIQAAINAGTTTGKSFTVLFSSMYLVNGALGGSNGENSILQLPSISASAGSQIVVSLAGLERPEMIIDGGTGSAQAPTNVPCGLITYNSAPSGIKFPNAPARLLWNCSMTPGSTTLTSPNGNFTNADIGKTVGIVGAWINANGAAGDLIATITAVTNSTTCTLSVPAVNSPPANVFSCLGVGAVIGVRGPTGAGAATWSSGQTPTFADTQTYDSIFGSGKCPFSNIVVQVKDMAVLQCAHPAISGIDLRYAWGAEFQNVLVSTARWITTADDSRGVNAPSQFGIAFPAVGNQAQTFVGNIATYGQYNGVLVSELSQTDQIVACNCNVGVAIWSVGHDVHISRLLAQYCQIGLAWYSCTGSLMVDQFDWEHSTVASPVDFADLGRASNYGDSANNGTCSGYLHTFGANVASGRTTGFITNYGTGRVQPSNFTVNLYGYYNYGSTPPTIRTAAGQLVGGVLFQKGTGAPSGAATLPTYYDRLDPSGTGTYRYWNPGGGSSTWTGIL